MIEQIISCAEEGSQFYYYRTAQGAELDLLWITDRGRRVGCEIKYSSAPVISKGFFQSIADVKADYKYIIVPEGETYTRSDGIVICGIQSFLTIEMPKLR